MQIYEIEIQYESWKKELSIIFVQFLKDDINETKKIIKLKIKFKKITKTSFKINSKIKNNNLTLL